MFMKDLVSQFWVDRNVDLVLIVHEVVLEGVLVLEFLGILL